MDALTECAIAAAVDVAGGLGLKGLKPELVRDGSNVLVHLKPSPVVARVATTTGWVRQPAETWLRRDLEVAAYLHGVGAPVVAPSKEVPPGPHVWVPAVPQSRVAQAEAAKKGVASLALSFWTYVQHEREQEVAREDALASLHDLHLALAGFPGELPYMGVVLDEIPHWLKWLEVHRRLSGQDGIELRAAHWKLASRLRPARAAAQTLHGDAHRGNLLRTAKGLLWTDFEDTCKGPVAWDVATFLHRELDDAQNGERESEEEMLAHYPGAPGLSELMPYLEARDLEGVVFLHVLASRFPDRAAEAARRLELWQRKRIV